MRMCWLFLLTLPALAQHPAPVLHADLTEALQTYQTCLTTLRERNSQHRDLPNLHFMLFGMGNRTKLCYHEGRLLNAQTGAILEQWRVRSQQLVPSEYTAELILWDSTQVQIRETETGVWVLQLGKKSGRLQVKRINGTKTPVALPRFADKPLAPVLRVLHHEVLMNVINGRPIPNFMVYEKPRYRDATLMAMVMRETGNLPLIHDWIMRIRDPFDRHNQGIAEADNLGQVLFLVSLVADKHHPVVAMVLDSVKRLEKGEYILGKTDYVDHPVFQTKWLKYGLKALALPDPYTIPKQYDSYSSLFWLAYTDQYVLPATIGKATFDEKLSHDYPHLGWAEDHFYSRTGTQTRYGMVGTIAYPLSWEQRASDANYTGMMVIDRALAREKLSFPHAGQAAEMFLLLNEQ